MANSLNNMQTATSPTFGEALRFWIKLGFISFGGPTGQIAIMQTELVERRRWISPTHFLHALNYCMLLPGPEAIQLAIYVGWLLHRVAGGLVAGICFLLPSVFILLGLSFVYAAYGSVSWIAALFYGLKPAVLGGLIATYFTFMPCFFWIFLGAPYMEQIRGNRFLSGALAAITAGVVGVVLNLAVWFGINVIFPAGRGIDWFALGVTVISFVAMQKLKLDIIPLVAGAAALGLIYRMLF